MSRVTDSSIGRAPGEALFDAPRFWTMTGPILVVGTDDESVVGALRIAELLARRERVNAHVLGVVQPVGFPVWAVVDVDPEALEEARRGQFLAALRLRVHQTVGRSALFSVGVATGSHAPTIAAAARDRRPELVIVGFPGGEKGAPHRAEREDAVMQIARAVDVPVLAVPPECVRLPRRAIVAVDFGATSRRAAAAAMSLLGRDATLTLAHVERRDELLIGSGAVPGNREWLEAYERGVARLFTELSEELVQTGAARVETMLLHGEPASAVLELARERECDLIATGTQGTSVLARHFTGSVSAALLRGARCAVLIAPPYEKVG